MKKFIVVCSAVVVIVVTLVTMASCKNGYSDPEEFVYSDPAVFFDGESLKLKYFVLKSDIFREANTFLQNIVDDFNILLEGDFASADRIEVKTEKDASYDRNIPELIVGYIDGYEEVKEAYSSVPYDSCGIVKSGNKIILVYHNKYQLYLVSTKLYNAYWDAADKDSGTLILSEETFGISEHSFDLLDEIPSMDGNNNVEYYQGADDSAELIFNDSSVEDYNAYVEKLKNQGYSVYTTNEIAGNLYTTLTNDKYTFTVMYVVNDSDTRAIIQNLQPKIPFKEDNVWDSITTPQLTLLGLGYVKDNGSMVNNGLSVLIRLSDGRFILIDGGHNYQGTAENLLSILREQSSEYAKNDSEITIAAWVSTHQHGDHVGLLNQASTVLSDINIESFIVNYISETEHNHAIEIYNVGFCENYYYPGETHKDWKSIFNEVAKNFGSTIYETQPGQEFYFADCEMEILYTDDLNGPDLPNDFNATSQIIKFTIGGTTFLTIGDSTGFSMLRAADVYGKYLTCDIMNILHHGMSPSGLNEAIEAYSYMQAATILWDAGFDYEKYINNEDNQAIVTEKSNPNFKEYFMAGDLGDTIVLPLPYTPGNAIVTRTK